MQSVSKKNDQNLNICNVKIDRSPGKGAVVAVCLRNYERFIQ
jgi:hypothetical protein